MTLTTVLINIGIVSVILTLFMIYGLKNTKSPVLSLLQNYCGVLFVFSGWVKAVDPLGTAYKMKDYFAEFESTFESTWMSFIAPIFPMLSEYVVAFSVFMIVLEIVLGLMLIMGHAPKWTAWIFFVLVLFFTFLTGFTYLTGYVPNEVNFFDFGQWAEFDKNNMKVKDCGCFGDFIKLVPFTSFMKDIFLLIPAFLFLVASKKMHVVFNKPVRAGILIISTIALLVYCINNYVWDIPHADFRPFKIGTNIPAVKAKEAAAMADVKITDWKMRHLETGEEIIVSNADYMGKDPNKNYKKYKGVYKVIDQIRTEPSIEATKISDFVIEDFDANDMTEDILSNPEVNFLIVNYKLKGDVAMKKRMVQDTIFKIDTLDQVVPTIVKTIDSVVEKEETYKEYNWAPDYLEKHKKLKAFTDAAKAKGIATVMAIGGSDKAAIMAFDSATQLGLKYGTADDILLKTIVRSNPGIVMMKNGVVIDKWHIKKLPSLEKALKSK